MNGLDFAVLEVNAGDSILQEPDFGGDIVASAGEVADVVVDLHRLVVDAIENLKKSGAFIPGVRPGAMTAKYIDQVLTRLTARDTHALISDGTIAGGMIPKTETALDALAGGVRAAVILDGRAPNACLLELFTEHGAGTLIEGHGAGD